jgi:hypothetical protein
MRHAMRLMGRQRLCELVTSNGGGVAGAISALSLELEAAEWDDPSDALDAFPKAELSGCRLRIPLHDGYLVILALNCVAGIVLVEFAGQVSGSA